MSDAADNRRFWLLEGSLKYAPITVSPEDMQMLQTRSFQIADIARFFGVPLFLLMEGQKDTSWGTGMEQQNIGFLTYGLQPYLTKMVQTYNRRIIPAADRSSVCVEVDTTPLLTMDSASMQAFCSSITQNGVLTRNEVRRKYFKVARATDENADVLTVQTALTPLSKLGLIAPGAKPAPAVSGAHVV